MKKFFAATTLVTLVLTGSAYAKGGVHVSSHPVIHESVVVPHESVPTSHETTVHESVVEKSDKHEETGVHTYSVPHPNIKSNGCPDGQHVNEYHQCVLDSFGL